jgi:hypothetical protein
MVNSLTAFIKKLRLRQILTVFLAGLLLIISTACSSPYPNAANPNNPAVQAGGGNNPYKNGGDKYTNSKMSKSGRDQASLQQFNSQQLFAATDKESELLYPGAETPVGRAYKEAGQYVENYRQGTPLPERVKNLGEDIGSSAKELTEGVTKGTQRGIENIKGNTQDAARDVTKGTQRSAEDAKINAQRTAEDAANAVNRTFDR